MMKPIPLLLCGLMLTACAGRATETSPTPPRAREATPTRAASSIKFIGHRGAAGEAPENTLAAFERGLQVGVDVVELDVHLSRDDQLIVMHDPRVDRTTDGSGLIRDLTLADLRRLNAAAKFKGALDYPAQQIPTLQEVYARVGTRAHMLIEIKVDAQGKRYPGIEARVLEVVRQNDALARTTIGSFDLETLQEMQRLEPRLPRTVFISTAYLGRKGMSGGGPDQIAAELRAAGVNAVGIEKSFAAQPLISALKQAGLGVGAWTVDDFVEMWKLIDLGVETITTNRPNLLLEKYRQGRNP